MAAAAGSGLFDVGARAIFTGVDDFITQLGKLGTSFETFASQGATADLAGNLREASKGFGVFNVAVASTERAVGTIGTTISTITAPVRTVASAVTTAAGEIVEGSGKIVGALGDVATATGEISERGVLGVAAVGTAIVGLAATAVTESAKYQRGMKDIEAVSQVVGPDLDTLDVAIRRVGVSFPASIGGIQRSALELSKAGVPIKDISTSILDLTVATEQLATGELSSEQAAEAIGSNLKLFARSFAESGDSVEQQAARIVNSIQGIANATRASSSEVISAVTKLGPNLAVLGGSVEQTAALAGLVVAQGPRGQEAGTALANLFQRLENPSREARGILQRRPDLNLFTAEGLPRPAIDVIKSFQDTYGAVLKTNQAINGLTPAMATAELAELVQTRSLRTLNLVLGLSTDDYRAMLNEISKTDVLKQAATQNEALIRQLEILRNNAVLAGVAFGHDFVEGIGGGVKVLNDFLRDGERAQAIAGVVGRAAAAVITGQGTDQARAAVNDSPFGTEGTATFDALNASSEKIRGNVVTLTRDAANLGKTLGLISFPEGLPGVIQGTGDAVGGLIQIADDVVKKFDELAPSVITDLQKITGASTFDELISNAQAFGKELAGIFTDNNGEQSFKDLVDAGVETLTTIRKEIAPTVLEVAKLGRAIEDAAPTFLGLADIVVTSAGEMARAVTEVIRLLTLLAAFDTNAIGNFFSGVGSFLHGFTDIPGNVAAAEQRSRFAFAGISPDQGSSRVAAGLGSGGIASGGVTTIEEVHAAAAAAQQRQALSALSEEERQTSPVVDLYNQALGRQSQAADDAAGGQSALGAAIGDSHGAYNTSIDDAKDAAAADKALEAAGKSLSSQMRTLGKDISDAGGSFDKTIQGAQERWIDGLNQIAESTSDAVGRIRRTASEARTRALEGFNIQTERSGGFSLTLGADGQAKIDEERGLVLGFNTVFRQGQEDQKRELQQGLEDRVTLRHQGQEEDTTAAARHNEELTRLEQEGQEGVTRARQQGIEDRERQRDREQENDLLRFSRGQERELTVFQQGQEAQSTARGRAREDQRASERLSEDLAKAATPEDRTKLLSAFTDERRTTARTRSDQDQDTRFAQQQQNALTAFRQGQEDTLQAHRRDIEDQNIAHRRDLEVSDITFRRQLEVDLILFRRNLEDQETNRRRVAAALEVAQTRREQLDVLGFDRTQQQEAQLFALINERIPDLRRQLTQVNDQENDQIQNTFENAGRQVLRAGSTFRREIQSAGVTEGETLRRLQERFENEAQNLLQRVPEGTPQRAALEAQIATARGAFAAQTATAQGGQSSQSATLDLHATQTTLDLLDQLTAAGANVESIRQLFLTPRADQQIPSLVPATEDQESGHRQTLRIEEGASRQTIESAVAAFTTTLDDQGSAHRRDLSRQEAALRASLVGGEIGAPPPIPESTTPTLAPATGVPAIPLAETPVPASPFSPLVSATAAPAAVATAAPPVAEQPEVAPSLRLREATVGAGGFSEEALADITSLLGGLPRLGDTLSVQIKNPDVFRALFAPLGQLLDSVRGAILQAPPRERPVSPSVVPVVVPPLETPPAPTPPSAFPLRTPDESQIRSIDRETLRKAIFESGVAGDRYTPLYQQIADEMGNGADSLAELVRRLGLGLGQQATTQPRAGTGTLTPTPPPAPLSPFGNTSGVQQAFGQLPAQSTVVTPLFSTPQVDRLTKAFEGLIAKIDKVAPGVHVDRVEQTIQAPTTPQEAVVGVGLIGSAV